MSIQYRDEVYPRVCGGTTIRARRTSSISGLSPRVRGNPFHHTSSPTEIGSIPACAGEPQTPSPSNCRRRVYPRVCGGTREATRQPQAARGLSPRVRGNRAYRRHPARLHRSIPACAGEPGRLRKSGRRPQVYPRVCGGTRNTFRCPSSGGGLSPRVRGNPSQIAAPVPGNRSIPACAGEPRGGRGRSRPGRVYPRVCGGTTNDHYRESHRNGLSPRVRGNRHLSRQIAWVYGSIPACAGEPPLPAR